MKLFLVVLDFYPEAGYTGIVKADRKEDAETKAMKLWHTSGKMTIIDIEETMKDRYYWASAE